MADVATISVKPTPNVIERSEGSRRIDVSANVKEGDLAKVVEKLKSDMESVQFPVGYEAVVLGEYAERQAASQRLLLYSAGAVIVVFLLLQAAFRSWRLAILAILTLPVALVGGVIAAHLSGGILSLGSLVGFLTLMGIAARNGILLINHCQHLEQFEGMTFGPALVLRGAAERLSPILMTTLATALALVPLVVMGNIPGHEIEHPMAVVILGGLVTSTLVNLFIVPSLYLRFAKKGPKRERRPQPAPAGPGRLAADHHPKKEASDMALPGKRFTAYGSAILLVLATLTVTTAATAAASGPKELCGPGSEIDFDPCGVPRSPKIDNKWFPLKPGMQYTTDGTVTSAEGTSATRSFTPSPG